MFSLFLDLSWHYLSVVRVTCRRGLWFSDLRRPYRFLVCGKDGLWSVPPNRVICEPVQCTSRPVIPDNAYLLSESSRNSFNDAVSMFRQPYYGSYGLA